MKNIFTTHFLYGLAIGILGALVFVQAQTDIEITQDELIAQYYASETATLVSPHSLREKMAHGHDTFILVDTRAKVDYEREHVVGAINIDTSQSPEEILAAFNALPEGKEVIIYCYSAACMNGRKAGNFLAENGVYVKEMTIGWNEWRYGWEMWNYEDEWETYKVEDFVVSGSEPGEVSESVMTLKPCGVDGEFSC